MGLAFFKLLDYYYLQLHPMRDSCLVVPSTVYSSENKIDTDYQLDHMKIQCSQLSANTCSNNRLESVAAYVRRHHRRESNNRRLQCRQMPKLNISILFIRIIIRIFLLQILVIKHYLFRNIYLQKISTILVCETLNIMYPILSVAFRREMLMAMLLPCRYVRIFVLIGVKWLWQA